MSSTEELERVFPSLIQKHTTDDGTVGWTAVAQELKATGITTGRNVAFTDTNARTWWNRHKARLLGNNAEPLGTTTEPLSVSDRVRTEPLGTTTEPLSVSDRVSTEPLSTTTEPLSVSDRVSGTTLSPSGEVITAEQWTAFVWEVWEVYRAGAFKEILEGKQLVADSVTPLMPEIKPDKNPTSISVSKELMQMALEKAKQDKANFSGTALKISGLVQWLAWRYIGAPETWPPDEKEGA